MFLPIQIESIISPNMLPSGKYEAMCKIYKSKSSESFVHLYTYSLCGTNEVLAYDVLIQSENKSQYFVDFAKLADNLWIDSYGLKSESIEKLLPVEILGYSLINEYFAGYVNVDGEINGK
jgi:hypothetical protein